MTTSSYADTNDDSLLIFFQNPSGGLNNPVRYAAGASAYSVAIADFNGDGRNDVAVGKRTDGIRVFIQDLGGGFTNFTDYATSYAHWICSADFDNDGRADLAGIGWSDSKVALFTQTTNGTLSFVTNYDASYSGRNDIEAGDVDNDGLMDIVVMSGQTYADPNVSVLLQTSNGFAPAVVYDLGGRVVTRGVRIGDVNGDDRNDIVVSYDGALASKIAVFQLTSSGVITNTYDTYDLPQPIVVADMDLDGRADIVTLHSGGQALGVYWQNAAGSLEQEQLFQPLPYASIYNPHGLAVGDINSDGMPDVVIADYNNGLIVLTNALPAPPLMVSRIQRKPDSSVVLTAPFRGTNGSCVVEASESLTNWTPIGVMSDRTWKDTNAPAASKRFYRLVAQ